MCAIAITTLGTASTRFGGEVEHVQAQSPQYLLSQNPTFCVTYRDGVAPSGRASVHSSVTIHRMPFFLAMLVTCRGADAMGVAGGAVHSHIWVPKKALVSAMAAA